MLEQLLTTHREEIIARMRARVAARSVPRPPDAALDDGIPTLLDQLSQIHSASRTHAANANAARYGGELLRMGFSISQVVYGYGDVCQALAELALERNTPIAADDLRFFHFCLDDAIASAVTEYEQQRDAEIPQEGAERPGGFAPELHLDLALHPGERQGQRRHRRA
ncbi:MAG: hypothetical protein ABI895_12860 [Deltaproteobacteria bacterium]